MDRDVAENSAETSRLLDEVERGVPGAFDRLFARHRKYLLDAVSRRLGRQLRARVDASDIVQEAQLESFRQIGDYLERRPMAFRLWLLKAAQERLRKARRRYLETLTRDLAREIDLSDEAGLHLLEGLVAADKTPLQQVSEKELIARVRQAVSSLSELDRETLFMRVFEGLRFPEIATVLGIDAAAARKRFGRALLRLRPLLKSDQPGSEERGR